MLTTLARRTPKVSGVRNMGWRVDFANRRLVSENQVEALRTKWNCHSPVVGYENPTFLKKGTRSKVTFYGLMAGVGAGLIAVLAGEYCMIMGVGMKPMLKEY